MNIEAEERSVAFIEKSVKEFKIFIDTCSLLAPGADKFWGSIVPILQRENKSIIIPYRVYQELEKKEKDAVRGATKDIGLQQRAVNAKKSVVRLQKAGLIQIFGDPNDNFADNVFQTVFTQYRMKYNLMLITQDKNLASDIFNISKSKSVNTKNRILVERINPNGTLSIHSLGTSQDEDSHSVPRPADSNIPDEERFAFARTVTKVSGSLSVSYIPKVSDEVIAMRNGQERHIQLVKEGPSGGEGTIYETSINGYVAKIYKKEKIDKAKHEKLKLMLTRDIDCKGVCFPIAVLYNTRKEFVGYLMPKAKGKELQKCVFIPQLLKKNPSRLEENGNSSAVHHHTEEAEISP